VKTRNIDPNTKAIASSGYANYAVTANFKKDGFSVVATKPFNFAVLEEILLNAVYTTSEFRQRAIFSVELPVNDG
jgi:DNA-binding NtrC family response regulator